jgi:hypothetical protein
MQQPLWLGKQWEAEAHRVLLTQGSGMEEVGGINSSQNPTGDDNVRIIKEI